MDPPNPSAGAHEVPGALPSVAVAPIAFGFQLASKGLEPKLDEGHAAADAEPVLGTRSAPITRRHLVSSFPASPCASASKDNPLAPHRAGAAATASGGLPTVGPALGPRPPLLSSSSDVVRRLRSLLTAAPVNFRDVEVEFVPQFVAGEHGHHHDDDAAADATGLTPTHSNGGAMPEAFAPDGVERSLDSSNLSGVHAAGDHAVGMAGPGGARPRGGGPVVRRSKLVIIMVGLPGRGKTFLCNKLCCYLNWLGHVTRHFNVGQYRRRQKHDDEVQDAEFFDHHNEAGMEARTRALNEALDDLMAWLKSDAGQVAVFDATNTTEARRNLLRARFHGVFQYLFIESICSDPAVLKANYLHKMGYSPDYKDFGMNDDKAVADFEARIAKYEAVYEPITDRNMHYIKLIDMVTGRGHMDINRISGYIPGKIVFFLMQVCKAGLTSVRKIWLTRHGESQYNQKALIGGNSSLSERGERYSRALPEALISRITPLEQEGPVSVAVWTSTLKRTIETARNLPFPKLRWKALDEINAGICDGLTYAQIEERHPEEFKARKQDKLCYRYPAGESYMDVIQRVEPVIIELERERECVVVVAHQAVLRAVYGYFMGVAPEAIPRLDMPLHTLIELTPMPDGSMAEERFPVDIDAMLAVGGAVGPERPLAVVKEVAEAVAEAQALGGGKGEAAGEEAGARAMSPESSVTSLEACGEGEEAAGGQMPASPAKAEAGEATVTAVAVGV